MSRLKQLVLIPTICTLASGAHAQVARFEASSSVPHVTAALIVNSNTGSVRFCTYNDQSTSITTCSTSPDDLFPAKPINEKTVPGRIVVYPGRSGAPDATPYFLLDQYSGRIAFCVGNNNNGAALLDCKTSDYFSIIGWNSEMASRFSVFPVAPAATANVTQVEILDNFAIPVANDPSKEKTHLVCRGDNNGTAALNCAD